MEPAEYFVDLDQPTADAAAVATLVGFDGYFRPSEVLAFRHDHVVEAHDRTWAFVVCPQDELIPSKTKTYDDTVAVPAHDERLSLYDLVASVRAAARNSESGLLCGGLALRELEALWRQAVKSRRWPLSFSPHSVRHGGPSHDVLFRFLDGRAVQGRGRWKSRASVRRYEKSGTLLRVRARLPMLDTSTARKHRLRKLVNALISRIRKR